MYTWKIYYDDGFTFDSTEDITKIAKCGVISIAEIDPSHNWTFWHSKDWYLFQKDKQWLGCDTNGMIDQILNRFECLHCVLAGRLLVPYSQYEAVIQRMHAECRPEKTGWHQNERQ